MIKKKTFYKITNNEDYEYFKKILRQQKIVWGVREKECETYPFHHPIYFLVDTLIRDKLAMLLVIPRPTVHLLVEQTHGNFSGFDIVDFDSDFITTFQSSDLLLSQPALPNM